MPLLNFKREFAEVVARGEKTITIRRQRKYPLLPGQRIYLYSGLRTRAAHKLGEGQCCSVQALQIDLSGAVTVDGQTLDPEQLERLARRDGFAGIDAFLKFFHDLHGLPFAGQLIAWTLEAAPVNANPEHAPYDAIATQYHQARQAGLEMRYVEELCRVVPPGAGVLDLGCGTGFPIMRELLAQGLRVTGVDHSAAMLAQARAACPDAALIHSDLRAFAPAECYAAIIAWDVLLHLPRRQHAAVFRQLRGWLVPGGWLLLSLGGSAWEGHAELFGHPVFYSAHRPATAKTLLRKAGFEIVWAEIDDPSSCGHLALLCRNAAT